MISSQVGALDIRSLDKKSSKPSSKEDKADFQNEMIKTEKKKKAKIDGREAIGTTANNQSRPTSPKTEEAASAKPKNVKNVKNESLVPMKVVPQQIQSSPEISAQVTEVDALTNLQTNIAPELTLEDASILSKTEAGGGIDLKGMQLVKSQQITTEPNFMESSTEILPQLESAFAASAVKPEKGVMEFLSQNSEQGSTGFESTTDLGALQGFSNKEAANLQQVFSNILENKVQGTEQLRQANVENLVSKATAIIKDGGGEMKLQLTPEGMGTIDLKVGMQNGQISVEIITQDQSVKKMFEDSILDMRGALENQNLKVDTFRVGVSEHFDQSMGQQAASQFAEREFARDFMGQFRDARQSLRQQGIDSFLDNRPGFNNSKPEGLSPANSVKNLNGRLNIIA